MTSLSMTQHYRSIDSFLEDAYASTAAAAHAERWSPRRLHYWVIILAMGIANSSDATEILCISYILSDPSFDAAILRGDVAWRGGLLAGSVFAGMLLGGFLVGALGDHAGRRPMLLFGLGANAVAGTLSALAPNAWILALLRLFAGVGIGSTVPPLFTLATELSPPSRRGFFVTVVASFWMVGSIYVAVLALWVFQVSGWGWRAFAVLCALPSALGTLMIYRFVPESPRFLAAVQGRHLEAVDISNKIARSMGQSARGSGTGQLTLRLEEVSHHYPLAVRSGMDIHRGRMSAKDAWADAIQSASELYTKNLKFGTTIPLQTVWFSLSFGSYGLLTWINTIFVEVHLEDVYMNALLFSLANLPGNIVSGLLVDRIGRRRMLMWSMGLAAVSLVCFAWYASDAKDSDRQANAIGVVLSACAFQAMSISGWNTIDCMTGELFPTRVRSTGMGVCTASGRIGALVAQFVNGALVSRPAALLLVASFTLILGAATPCFLSGEDMSQMPLEDDTIKDHLSDDDEDKFNDIASGPLISQKEASDKHDRNASLYQSRKGIMLV